MKARVTGKGIKLQKESPVEETIVIVGNPNVGKSLLFNELDHIYSIVANYPYTTVEVARSEVKVGANTYKLLDCPGITSLAAHSEDELVTRDVLIKENPALVILCLDATNIERSLLLACQIMELQLPLILTLNLMDESQRKGTWVDSGKLEAMLSVPVVETITTQKKGLDDLLKVMEFVLERRSVHGSGITYKKVIEDGLGRIRNCFETDIPSPAVQMLLLTQDRDIEAWIEHKYGSQVTGALKSAVSATKRSTPNSLASIILEDRMDWVERIVEDIIRKSLVSTSNISEKIGWFARHPVWGWPVLALIVYITYLLVGKIAAGRLVGLLEEGVFDPVNRFIGSNIPSDFLRDLLVGDYGIISAGLGDSLATAFPILGMFFLILNIMEDTGYFTNLCILTSRCTKKLGLSGKAMFPLMLGFGCKTMATLTTKILDSKKERYIATLLIAFAIPCAPQTGLIMGVLGSLSFSAFLIVFGVLALVELIAGIVLNRILPDDVHTDFILEVPAIRFPNIKNLFVKLYYRMKWFMKEVPPLFVAGAFLLFVLDKTGSLLQIKKVLSPVVVSFLSLPVETVDSFLLCLVKHEAGAARLISIADGGVLSPLQTIVSLIIIASLGPCVANFMAIIKQFRLKQALVMRFAILVASICTGGVVNWVARIGRKLLL